MKLMIIIVLAVLGSIHVESYEDDIKGTSGLLSQCIDRLGGKHEDQQRIVAFAAAPSSDMKDLAQHAIIIFDHVSINTGDVYDPKSGKFTAPVAGLYKFDWTILAENGKYCVTCLMHDSKIVGINHPGDKSDWGQGTQTTILELKAGEKVWMRARDKCQYVTRFPYSTFNGFKL